MWWSSDQPEDKSLDPSRRPLYPPQTETETPIARYKGERECAEFDHRMALVRRQEREREQASVRATVDQRAQEEATRRTAMTSGTSAHEDLPACQDPIACQQQTSQQTISQDQKQQNLYRPANDGEASQQTQPQQQSFFQSNNPYRQSSAARRRNPAFREGWDQAPTPGINRPPTYDTSERARAFAAGLVETVIEPLAGYDLRHTSS